MPTSKITKLDDFTRAYVECALWSSTDESTPDGGEPFDKNYGIEDIAPDSLLIMITNCLRFQSENIAHITNENYCYTNREASEQAGHDFWLTRNGHGCGFWDGDWVEPAATILTDTSGAFGECNLYVGDDGMIHI